MKLSKYLAITLLSILLFSCGSTTTNSAPTLASISAQSTNEDTAKTVTLSGTDADGNSLTYSATSSTSNVTISVSDSTLTLTPAANWNGTATITAKVNDGKVDSAAQTFTLTVSAVNDTPTLASISNQSTDQGVNKTLTITGADVDGDSLTYTLTSSPADKVTGSVSGTTLTLTPLVSYSGTATLTLTVSDGTLTADQSFDLVVSADDPLYQYQWHLNNSGQTNFSDNAGTSAEDINIDGAIADGYTGDGVIVAIVDSGLELAHEDLAANVVSGGSWDYLGSDTDPTSSATTGDHGTSVAGLTASVGWNSKGGRGVAPSASLKGFNFICSGCSQSTSDNVNAHGGTSYSEDVDIFNQSYGTSNTSDSTINTTVEAQFLEGVTSLRSDKGAIYIKSSGNGFNSITGFDCSSVYSSNTDVLTCQNANSAPLNTLPYNITVGALGATGVKSSYSTAGSALWVSAPGGEYGYNTSSAGSGYSAATYKPAMTTTDQSGCSQGYVRTGGDTVNAFDTAGHAENSSCNYTSTFNGTSSAAPVLSGAVAMILEANSTLTWRDVKHILATTSGQVNPTISDTTITIDGNSYIAEPAWLTNDAGHKFHNYYGFGKVNVGSAITSAKAYTAGILGTFTTTSWQSSGTLSSAIPDNSTTGVSNAMTVSSSYTIEAVQIKINASHTATGDLAIELTSPAGTRSVLMTPWNTFGLSNDLTNMVLLSNAFYGESTNGNWTIKVIDAEALDTGSLTDWSIRFFGH